MSVKVEHGIPIDSWWIKDFLTISSSWQEYAENKKVAINGRVNAYGVEFQLDLNDIEFFGRKKQEFTKVGGAVYDLKPNPFSEILVIKGQSRPQRKLRLILRRNNFLNRIKGLIYGLNSFVQKDNWIVYTNSENEDLLGIIGWLIENTKLHLLKIDSGKFELRLLSIPRSNSQIEELEKALNELKAVANRA